MRGVVADVHTTRAMTVLALAFALTMIGTTLPTPMYVIYQDRFGFSLTMSTVIFAVYAGGVLAALLLFGRWSDVLGRKPLLLAGLASAALSDVVFLSAGSTGSLLLGRVLSGLSAGLFVGTATAAVVEAAPARWRARVPVVATVANIGGLGLGPLLAGIAVDKAPWDTHLSFVVHLALTAVLALALLTVPETVEVTRGARPGVARLAVPAHVRTTFVGASVAAFAGFAVFGLFVAVSPRFVAANLDHPSATIEGLVVFSAFATSVLAQVLLRPMATSLAVDLGCGLLSLGMVVLVLGLQSGSVALIVVAAVVAGAGQGLSFSKGLAAVLAQVHTAERAGVTSAFFVVAYVAISLPVVGEGLAAQRWGLTPAGSWFAGGVAVLSALALVTLVVDQRRAPTPTAPG